MENTKQIKVNTYRVDPPFHIYISLKSFLSPQNQLPIEMFINTM